MSVDSSTCASCPAGSVPNPVATTLDDVSCVTCPRGQISAEGDEECTSCPLGTVANANRTVCETCPESDGVTCTGSAMSLDSGYWVDVDDVVVEYDSESNQIVRMPESSIVHVCSSTAVCVSNLTDAGVAVDDEGKAVAVLCADGHDQEVPLCSVCEGDFAQFSGQCSKCWSEAANTIVIVITILIAVIIAAAMVARTRAAATKAAEKGNLLSATIRIGLNYLKLITTLGAFRAKAPEVIASLQEGASTVSNGLSSNVPPVACAFDFTFVGVFWATMTIPLLILAGCAIVAAVLYARASCATQREQARRSELPA